MRPGINVQLTINAQVKLVIATKYSTNFRAEHGESEIMINSTGNSAKSLTTSVHASLENLQTDYIDIVSAVYRAMERGTRSLG